MDGSNSIPKAFQIAEFLQKSVFLRLNRHTSFTPTRRSELPLRAVGRCQSTLCSGAESWQDGRCCPNPVDAMNNAIEIAEKFAQALDAEDYDIAGRLLSGECKYLCRGQLHVGPAAIIASYQDHGDAAERKFENVRYESVVIPMPNGAALIQFTDHLSLKGKHFTFQCEQVVEIGEDDLITRIEHRDILGQKEALAAFMNDE